MKMMIINRPNQIKAMLMKISQKYGPSPCLEGKVLHRVNPDCRMILLVAIFVHSCGGNSNYSVENVHDSMFLPLALSSCINFPRNQFPYTTCYNSLKSTFSMELKEPPPLSSIFHAKQFQGLQAFFL